MLIKLIKFTLRVLFMSALVIIGVQALMFLKTISAVQIIEEEIVPWRMQQRDDAPYDAEIRVLSDYSMCSAVVISDNYALSAAHCSDTGFFGGLKDTTFKVVTKQGWFTGIDAKFIALDNNRDVALIKGDFRKFNIKIPNFNYEAAGYLQACGFPANGAYHCEEIYITGNKYFQYKARGRPLYPGMSGGAVFDYKGYVVGINSAVDVEQIVIGPLVGVDAEWGIQ